MKFIRRLILIFYLSLACFYLYSQETTSLPFEGFNADPRYNTGVRIVFYNVENLFDIFDDSIKNDDEFTPEGFKAWNQFKYFKKINNIYKTLISVGGWEPPGIIGLCEVENRNVLDQLIDHTPLFKYKYEVVHIESPDYRGIDVALLFRPVKFRLISYEAITVNFPFNKDYKTRDILYVKGIVLEKETIHIFINHWPSRYGGYLATKPKREQAATVLRSKVDSLIKSDSLAKIIIIGDFNDEPNNESITDFLKAKSDTSNLAPSDLFNLMPELHKASQIGSHKYRGNWSFLDQIIISASLLQNKKGLHLSRDNAQVFKAGFLLEEDPVYLGNKPFRTYSGPRYLGGFSDHLPVYIDLILSDN